MWLGDSSHSQFHSVTELGEVAGGERIAFTIANPKRGVVSAGPSAAGRGTAGAAARGTACAAGSTGADTDAPPVSK